MTDPKDLPTSFWQAVAEIVPRHLFGDAVVDSWRSEKQQRDASARCAQMHLDSILLQSRPFFPKD